MVGDVPKRPRKPRKKAAQKISEAYEAGLAVGRDASTGGLATLIVGTFCGAVSTLIFVALYHAMHHG